MKKLGILYDNISGNIEDLAIGLSVRKILRGIYDKFKAPGTHILNSGGIVSEGQRLPRREPEPYCVDDSKGLLFNIDQLLVKGRRVYGWGWLFHKNRVVSEVWLSVKIKGNYYHFPCSYGVPRPDVAKRYNVTSALNSGFVLFCSLPQGTAAGYLLEVCLSDGSSCCIDATPLMVYGSPIAFRCVFLIRRWITGARDYLVRGDLRGLLYRIGEKTRELRRRPGLRKFNISQFSSNSMVLQRSKLALMIDHNLGGGANRYRERWINKKREAGNHILLLYYDLATLCYYIRSFDRDNEDLFVLESIEAFADFIPNLKLEEIFLNNVFSFDDTLSIASLLPVLKHQTSSKLIIAVHDYFSICPSYTLLDDSGKFCGVPDIARCRECLLNNHGDFSFLVEHKDIDLWRKVWSNCLNTADTILCFSHSSMELLCRAYPELDSAKFEVCQHVVDYLPTCQVSLNYEGPLNIGIVGRISEHKGASIIRQMAHIIQKRHLPATITIIGELEGASIPSVIKTTGLYKREELPKLIENSGVNVFFLPSIWPETFSYVAEELIQLNVPLAVFELGAPAERVASYVNGMIIREVDAEHVVEQLMAFHSRLRKSFSELD